MDKKWNKEELKTLYETHTLEEIGNKFDVSRERVRQVMNHFGIKRRAPHPHEGIGQFKNPQALLIPQPIPGKTLDETVDIARKLIDGVCPTCGGKGYREYDSGLTRLRCRDCQK